MPTRSLNFSWSKSFEVFDPTIRSKPSISAPKHTRVGCSWGNPRARTDGTQKDKTQGTISVYTLKIFQTTDLGKVQPAAWLASGASLCVTPGLLPWLCAGLHAPIGHSRASAFWGMFLLHLTSDLKSIHLPSSWRLMNHRAARRMSHPASFWSSMPVWEALLWSNVRGAGFVGDWPCVESCKPPLGVIPTLFVSRLRQVVIALLSGKLVNVLREGDRGESGGFLRKESFRGLPRTAVAAGGIVLQSLSSLSLNFQANPAYPSRLWTDPEDSAHGACEDPTRPYQRLPPVPGSSLASGTHCRCPRPNTEHWD